MYPPPEYKIVSAATDIVFDGANAITSDGAATGTDLSQFVVGDTLQISGTTSNNTNYGYNVTAVVSDSELTVYETTVSESPASCTIETFNGSHCGEVFIAIKRGPGPFLLEGNTILNIRNTGTNADATGANGAAMTCLLDAENVTFRNNRIINCNQGITSGNWNTNGLERNLVYEGNLILPGKGVDFPAAPIQKGIEVTQVVSARFENNTIIGEESGDRQLFRVAQMSHAIVRNNVMVSGTVIDLATQTYQSANVFNDVASVPASLVDAASLEDVELKLDESYAPLPGSPCLTGGVNTELQTDVYRRKRGTGSPFRGAEWPPGTASQRAEQKSTSADKRDKDRGRGS